MTDSNEIQLVRPGIKPRAIMLGLAVLLPLLITGASLLWAAFDTGPENLIADSMALASMVIILGLVALTLPLWWFLDRAMGRHELRLDQTRLHVRTSFYSIDLALPELVLEAARVIDLDERIEYRPRLKTNGYSLPGFHSGHFRLRNGEKAFVATAGCRRALWIPTRRDKGLLLQPHQPEALLQRLRELARDTPRR